MVGARAGRAGGGIGLVALVLLTACAPSGSPVRGENPAALEASPTTAVEASPTTPEAEQTEPPARFVALTPAGDVVVIDRASRTRTLTLASFPPSEDPDDTGEVARAEEVAVLPDGRVLVGTCCAPAAGVILIVDEDGETVAELLGRSPQPDAEGGRVALAGVDGITVLPASLSPPPLARLEPDPSLLGFVPEDLAWSPEGEELAFTLMGRLGLVRLDAGSLVEATFLDPAEGSHWSSPVFTVDGIVAVEQSGAWRPGPPSGPGKLVRVDPGSGATAEIDASPGPVTDVAVDASGRYLLWVADGRLRWRVDETTEEMEGGFIAAAWVPATP